MNDMVNTVEYYTKLLDQRDAEITRLCAELEAVMGKPTQSDRECAVECYRAVGTILPRMPIDWATEKIAAHRSSHVAASVAPYKEALASMVSMVRSGEPFHDDGSCAGCNKIRQLLTPTTEGQDGGTGRDANNDL